MSWRTRVASVLLRYSPVCAGPALCPVVGAAGGRGHSGGGLGRLKS